MVGRRHRAKRPTVNDSHLLPLIQNLQFQVRELREELHCLQTARPRVRRDPDFGFVSVRNAAEFCGRSLQGVQSWLKRLARDPDAVPVRRLHGRVHLGDLKRLLESRRIVGAGERVARALRNGRGMV